MSDSDKIIPNLLGPKPPALSTDVKTYTVTQPHSGSVPHRVQASTPDDLRKAVEVCRQAQYGWAQMTVAQRTGVIVRAAELLEDGQSGWASRLAEANMAETDVGAWWAHEQPKFIPGMMRTWCGVAEKALQETIVEEESSSIHISREPYGVCLAMAPWNAVQVLTMRSIVTPLLAGNAVLLKTSEITPYTQYLWGELLYEAGLPEGVLCVVHVDAKDAPELVPTLVCHPAIRHVNFTGSTRVGSIVAKLAGEQLKPCVMELGGKASVLLLPDADFGVAASHILFGAFMNSGQVCMSTERILVGRAQYDDLVNALQRAWKARPTARARRLFSHTHEDGVRVLVDDAIRLGAANVLVFESGASGLDGRSVEDEIAPMILGPATPEMRIYTQETFAPIAIIIPVEGSGTELVDNMVEISNASEYGLTASVWGEDVRKAVAVAKRLEAGAVHINNPTILDPPLVPHGGWKKSGFGRFNGVEGLHTFTQTRSIEVPRKQPQPLPIHIMLD